MKYLYNSPITLPRNAQYGSDYWIAYSIKLQRKVKLYSMLEYANFITLEMDPNVAYFCEQPKRIAGEFEGSKMSSVLDFWVCYIDGTHIFQEVKYDSEIHGTDEASLRSQNQISFQTAWCKENGMDYEVVTDKELFASEYRIPNLELLRSYILRNETVKTNAADEICMMLKQGAMHLSQIKELQIVPAEDILPTLATMYYQGKVTINIDERPIDNYSEVMYAR